jgi:hypothetical protein
MWLSLILMLMVVSVSSMACERLFYMVIENQTSQTLTVHVDDYLVGTVAAGGNITSIGMTGSSVHYYSIVAKSAQGETVFSKKLKMEQMQQIGRSDYFKVVIPPQPSP